MRDVKGLVQGVYLLAAISFVFLLVVKGAGYYIWRWAFAPQMALLGLYGACLTLALVLSVGLFALVGFDSLFLLFHQVSFTNDLWQLDPRSDYLLIMFPQGFWFDATIRVAATTIAGAVLIAAVSGGYLWYSRRRAEAHSDT
jgi:integral membrane protein (TIGR01906 family)